MFGRPAAPHQTEEARTGKLKGRMEAAYASPLIRCGLVCQIFIAQLIGMGSGIKTQTVKIYTWGRGSNGGRRPHELQRVGLGERKHHMDSTIHSRPVEYVQFPLPRSEPLSHCPTELLSMN